MVDAWRLSKSVDDQLPVPRIKVSHGEQWIGTARQKNTVFPVFFPPKVSQNQKKSRIAEPAVSAPDRLPIEEIRGL